MLTTTELTPEQQYIIAEFLCGQGTDTLIKSDGEALIQVFQDHHIPEAFVTNLAVEDICELLVKNTTREARVEIWDKYTKGELN